MENLENIVQPIVEEKEAKMPKKMLVTAVLIILAGLGTGFLLAKNKSMTLPGGKAQILNTQKMVGSTEPKASAPGTIRGDYSHVSYEHADSKNTITRNLIHASSSKDDAKRELELWFKKEELHTYKTVHEIHTL